MQVVVNLEGENVRKFIEFHSLESFLKYVKDNGGRCLIEYFDPAIPPTATVTKIYFDQMKN